MVTCNTKDLLAHIEKYEKKLNTHFFEDWDLKQYPFVLLLADGSFFVYGPEIDSLDIGPTCGEFNVLLPWAKFIAKLVGYHKLTTVTKRNPKAYARLTGATLVKSVEFDDRPTEYYFELEVD